MQLSPEQESAILEANMHKIYRAVDNYTARCSHQMVDVPTEDFVQEVAIAFLKYIRKCEKMEDIDRFPWYDAKQAMTCLVLEFQPVTVPKRTMSFNDVIHQMPKTVSYEVLMTNGMDVDGMSKYWQEDQETKMDFDSFMSNQDDGSQRMAAMRLYGMKLKDIAGQFGVSKVAIHKRFQKMGNQYSKFMEEPENE